MTSALRQGPLRAGRALGARSVFIPLEAAASLSAVGERQDAGLLRVGLRGGPGL